MPSDLRTDNPIDSARRQMGAVVAKSLESVEELDFIRTNLHPMELYEVRRVIIRALWDAYNVGLRLGKNGDLP